MIEGKLSRREKVLRLKRKLRRKHLFWIVPVVGVFILVLVQIFYPANLARPLIKFNEQNIGFISRAEISDKIQKVSQDAKFIFELDGHSEEIDLHQIGGRIDEGNVVKNIFDYKFIDRLVPFSIFYSKNIDQLNLKFDEKELNKFVEQYSNKHKIEVKNASISIASSGDIVVSQGVDGREIKKQELKKVIASQNKKLRTKNLLNVPFEKKKSIGGEDVLSIKKIIESKILRGLRVSYNQNYYFIQRNKLATFIAISNNDSQIKLSVNEENAKNYINQLNKNFEIPAQDATVNIVDGREVSREGGKEGKRISYINFKADLEKFLQDQDAENYILLNSENVSPKENKKFSYTNTQEGLRAKVNDIGKRYDVRIAVRQLNGSGWSAGYRENESTPSASTYKLYVALKLFDEMKKSDTNWDSQILGTSYRDCFNQMIVISTNACAEEWIRQFGRGNINNYIYNLGISNQTTFTSYDATRTTAGDLVRVVSGIYEGKMAGGEYRDFLLQHMARQIHRKGIPSGTVGRVYDKVGFLWDYVHDTGVIEHPRGTYALAVMTKGANYATIAQITRELEEFMYP